MEYSQGKLPTRQYGKNTGGSHKLWRLLQMRLLPAQTQKESEAKDSERLQSRYTGLFLNTHISRQEIRRRARDIAEMGHTTKGIR